MKVIGIDGCKAGWFVVEYDNGNLTFKICENIHHLKEDIYFSNLTLIDMPMGFRDQEQDERRCDLQARKMLGKGWSSSIFPVPCRKAVYAIDYQSANRINKEEVNRGLSKQTWWIMSKMKEVDGFIRENPGYERKLCESHPELTFMYLNAKVSLKYKKKTEDGIKERLKILEKYDENAIDTYYKALETYKRKDLKKDDIVDGISLAVNARLIIERGRVTLPEREELDAYDIPMQISLFRT